VVEKSWWGALEMYKRLAKVHCAVQQAVARWCSQQRLAEAQWKVPAVEKVTLMVLATQNEEWKPKMNKNQLTS
jgi:hypothetical protein